MAKQGERLDIIIFGATGFTGKIAVFEAVKLAKEKNFTWGIAGRSHSKLKSVLNEVSEKSGEDMTKVPIVIADVGDEESLKKMAAQARVIVNCVGPYRFHGEAVVKSCLAGGAHHLDISPEAQFMETMQLKYHDLAANKGLYVVGACGMDCIPTDLAVVFLKKQFQGDVNSVEVYIDFGPADPSSSEGALGHYTTYESVIHIVANYKEMRSVHKKLFPVDLPVMKPKLQTRSVIHNRDKIGWCFPFLGADRSVIERSQRHFYDVDKQRPIQAQTYFVTKSMIQLMKYMFMAIMFALLANFQFGRNILLKYPGFFTGGLFSHDGPSDQTRKNEKLKVTVFGEGWKEKSAEPSDQHATPPNKKITVEVTCMDPGYGSTSVMILLSALTILNESDKMPGRGGVYTTGAAFAKTSLIDDLNNHSITFAVTSST